ncbi:MAG: FecR family protein [Bacteroidota bacterium]
MLSLGNELDELLQNDDFIRWVLTPDDQSEDYWNNWQQQDPVRKETLHEAKEIVLSIYNNEKSAGNIPDKELTREAWKEISRHIYETKKFRQIRFSNWYKYAAAAIVVSITGLSFFLIQHSSGKVPGQQAIQHALSVNNLSISEIEFKNNGENNEIVNLADGSRVTLSKNSSLHYTRLFDTDKREVYLHGEAFFEVAKDAKRPFYVYSGKIVTKVLGTSFRIISDDNLGKTTVAVRTGKVTVFRQDEAEQQNNTYTLTPNEQVVFNDKVTKPVKENIQDARLLENEAPAPPDFRYDETSLNTIIETLAKTYSVDIIYDKAKNEKCLVTISLDGESLYAKLDLLCKVVGASYRIEGYKIYLDSKGCN